MADLRKTKGRRETGPFFPVPYAVLNSENYKKLSSKAVKLLFDLSAQVRMKSGGTANNGDLCITLSVLKERGWNSRDSLYKARDELLHYGFIEQTKHGGLNMGPNLYSLSFFAVDECNGKLDVSPTTAPSNVYRETKKDFKKLKSLSRKTALAVPNSGTDA